MAARAPRPGLPERFACRRLVRGIPARSDASVVLAAGDRCNLHRAGDESAQVTSATGDLCPAAIFDRGCRAPRSHGTLPTVAPHLRFRMDGPGVRIGCGT